jgi:release factor glutamine methyltransferase
MTRALTIGAAIAQAAERLAACGIDEPRRDARLLAALAAGLDTAAIVGYPERPLNPAARERFERLVERRAAREPISRIAGRREFWSLDFALSRDTLDPRPDSEAVVAAALARLPDRAAPLRLLDLGTGTGCLLLALLSELPNAWGVGLDLLPGAAALARRNAAAMGLESRAFFAAGRWAAALRGGHDVVLANPPYVPSAAIAGLAPEVARFEPRPALDGGSDGLHAYRELAPDLARLVKPGGFAVIEVGAGQADAVQEIFAGQGLDQAGRHRDFGGIERCLVVSVRKKLLDCVHFPSRVALT